MFFLWLLIYFDLSYPPTLQNILRGITRGRTKRLFHDSESRHHFIAFLFALRQKNAKLLRWHIWFLIKLKGRLYICVANKVHNIFFYLQYENQISTYLSPDICHLLALCSVAWRFRPGCFGIKVYPLNCQFSRWFSVMV